MGTQCFNYNVDTWLPGIKKTPEKIFIQKSIALQQGAKKVIFTVCHSGKLVTANIY